MNLGTIELMVVAAVFVLAGLVKGVIGVGLPTIAMGLLGALMAPNRAAAILVIPALLTNVWQMWDGPALPNLLRRLWPMLMCALLGTLPVAGILAAANVRLTTALLGVALMSYALIGLSGVHFKVPRRTEPVLGPLIGLATGFINGATGIFVVPGVPYLQALDLGKDELLQALAISAFISTVALALGLGKLDRTPYRRTQPRARSSPGRQRKVLRPVWFTKTATARRIRGQVAHVVRYRPSLLPTNRTQSRCLV